MSSTHDSATVRIPRIPSRLACLRAELNERRRTQRFTSRRTEKGLLSQISSIREQARGSATAPSEPVRRPRERRASPARGSRRQTRGASSDGADGGPQLTDLGRSGRFALTLARKGFYVFPLHTPRDGCCSCGDQQCGSVGKHPRTPGGVRDATRDPKQIRAWWSEHPNANVGIATGGRSRLYVIDVDGPQGRKSLRRMQALFGPLTDTLIASTGNGWHLYFRLPRGITLRNAAGQTLGGHIHGRGEGGYVVAPPSLHRSGRRYAFRRLRTVAALPEPLVEYLRRRPRQQAGEVALPDLDALRRAAHGLPAHERARLQRRAAGALRWAVRRLHELPTEEGNARGDAFFGAACLVGRGVGAGVLDHDEARSALERCAANLGLPKSHQAWRSIARGLARGAQDPFLPESTGDIADSLDSFRSSPTAKPVLDRVALHGVAGDIVREIEPHTEADPAAILLQILALMGNSFGRGVGVDIEADRHSGSLFVVLVGDSAVGRKGVSFSQALRPIKHADESIEHRIRSGLSTGEGLIHHIRDADEGDGGVPDKRLVILETELASVLRRAKREGSSLSAVIRQAFDGLPLATLTKRESQTASGHTITIIGHITVPELRKELGDVEIFNGWVNRFLWVIVVRSKSLPHGGDIDSIDLTPMVERLRASLEFVGSDGERSIGLTPAAKRRWEQVYESLASRPASAFGSATARAAAYVRRIALIYAALDCAENVDVVHLNAALAVWQYCEASARYLFGGRHNHALSPRILSVLGGEPEGMTRTGIHRALSNNASAEQLTAALKELVDRGELARVEIVPPGGSRRIVRWHIATNETNATTRPDKDPDRGLSR